MALLRPSEGKIGSVNGGDDSVKRDGKGRPVLVSYCWLCDGTGRRPGKTSKGVKCTGCTDGIREKAFKRVTTFIDVLESKDNLMAWAERMVLIGVAMDSGLRKDVLDIDVSTTEGRNEVNRRAKIAKDLAGASVKSEQGTYLHGLSEIVDKGETMPTDITDADFEDMRAYIFGTHNMDIRHIERLVVHDRLGTAGTPDRVSRVIEPMTAPDGSIITPDQQIITDLKTGRVDFGGLKMAMQLGIYANSEFYVEGSPEREPIEDINKDWGLIMHLAAGSGEFQMYWADLRLGMEAVEVASAVYDLRRRGRKALIAA